MMSVFTLVLYYIYALTQQKALLAAGPLLLLQRHAVVQVMTPFFIHKLCPLMVSLYWNWTITAPYHQ